MYLLPLLCLLNSFHHLQENQIHSAGAPQAVTAPPSEHFDLNPGASDKILRISTLLSLLGIAV